MTRQNALFFAHVQVLSLLAVLLLCKVQILTQNCARAAAVPVPLVHRRIPVCVQLSSAPRAQSAMLRFCGRRMKICKYIQIEDMQYIQIYECAYACRSVCRYVCMYVCMFVCKFNGSIGRCSRQMYSRHVLDECSREGQVSPTNSVSYKLKLRIAAQVLI